MKKQKLGRTNLEITKMGFGAWPIGGLHYGDVSRDVAKQCIHTYLNSGGNFLDTARGYGASESIIGEVLKERGDRDQVVIASKSYQLTEGKIRADLEMSLKELQVDAIDLYYVHKPPAEWEKLDEILELYSHFKKEGKIKHIGISVKGENGPNVNEINLSQCDQYIADPRIDVLQMIYSVFRQTLKPVFKKAEAAGVGIVARTIYENGFLTGKYLPGHIFPEGDHRRRWSVDRLELILKEVQLLNNELPSGYESLSQLAFRFAYDEEGITSIIPGAKTISQIENNLQMLDLPQMNHEVRNLLNKRYENRFQLFNTVE